MLIFPIRFSFDGNSYTANLERIGAGPVQYHVHNIEPKDFEFRDYYIFSVDKSGEGLEWGIDHSLPVPMYHEIAKSILQEVKKLNIPLVDPH